MKVRECSASVPLRGVGYDPGTATGAYAVLEWRDQNPHLVECSSWQARPSLEEELGVILKWISLAPAGAEPCFVAIEDQRFAHLPHSGVAGRTSAAALGPLMAQSVVMAWAYDAGNRVVLVQPMAHRHLLVGSGSAFRCPRTISKEVRERARRAHDKLVEDVMAKRVRSIVRDVPEGITCHEVDAISVALAGRQQLLKEPL